LSVAGPRAAVRPRLRHVQGGRGSHPAGGGGIGVVDSLCAAQVMMCRSSGDGSPCQPPRRVAGWNPHARGGAGADKAVPSPGTYSGVPSRDGIIAVAAGGRQAPGPSVALKRQPVDGHPSAGQGKQPPAPVAGVHTAPGRRCTRRTGRRPSDPEGSAVTARRWARAGERVGGGPPVQSLSRPGRLVSHPVGSAVATQLQTVGAPKAEGQEGAAICCSGGQGEEPQAGGRVTRWNALSLPGRPESEGRDEGHRPRPCGKHREGPGYPETAHAPTGAHGPVVPGGRQTSVGGEGQSHAALSWSCPSAPSSVKSAAPERASHTWTERSRGREASVIKSVRAEPHPGDPARPGMVCNTLSVAVRAPHAELCCHRARWPRGLAVGAEGGAPHRRGC